MKKILLHSILFSLSCFLSLNLKAQSEKTRILSYSELFSEMTDCKEKSYHLKNATIKYNPNTDMRFLEMDSVQLAGCDSIKIACMVIMEQVHFKNPPQEANNDFKEFLPGIGLQKIQFSDTVMFVNSEIEFESIKHCSFLTLVQFYDCVFTADIFGLINCSFKETVEIIGCDYLANVVVHYSEIKHLDWGMSNVTGYLGVVYCDIDQFSSQWSEIDRIIFNNNTIKQAATFTQLTVNLIEIYENHFSNLEVDSLHVLNSLIKINQGKFQRFYWSNNSFSVQNNHAGCLILTNTEIASAFTLINAKFPNYITIRDLNVLGAFNFGKDCAFEGKIFMNNVYFNQRSNISWSNLRNKICQSDFKGMRQFPQSMDSMQPFGLLERELLNKEYCEGLIKSKRIFYNVFREQGLINNANEVKVEIKDLETEIWRKRYFEEKNIKKYFNWKMNVFLKKFSAYGTDPVIAIIFSLKVILIFALFYLFLYNDWDLSNRKKIGKRLGFMLKYLQIDKGLLELDQEDQKHENESLNSLQMFNEASSGKVPALLIWTIRWYVHSTLLSNKLRVFVLRRMDLLSGTYAKLGKAKRTKVAFFSGFWLLIFFTYTLLVKVLNALTLSLNAFTTLGFGNIPTRGFSRYVVIAQGFIGWVLMTIFSVTLISQLLQ